MLAKVSGQYERFCANMTPVQFGTHKVDMLPTKNQLELESMLTYKMAIRGATGTI